MEFDTVQEKAVCCEYRAENKKPFHANPSIARGIFASAQHGKGLPCCYTRRFVHHVGDASDEKRNMILPICVRRVLSRFGKKILSVYQDTPGNSNESVTLPVTVIGRGMLGKNGGLACVDLFDKEGHASVTCSVSKA